MWFVLGAVSGIVLGLTDLAAKYASIRTSALSLLFSSNLLGAVFLTLALTLKIILVDDNNIYLSIDRELFFDLVPKNLTMVLSLFVMYVALRSLPMSFAGAIRASGPLWTLLGAWLLTSETLTGIEMACVAGSILIYLAYARLGRYETAASVSRGPVLLMVLATVMSSLVTSYDKYLALKYGIEYFDAIQFLSAYQRVVFSGALLIPFGSGICMNRVVLFNGVGWALAEYVYFFAYSNEDAKATVLAVLRRLSLVTGLVGGALIFREQRIARKAALCTALVVLSAVMLYGADEPDSAAPGRWPNAGFGPDTGG